jgi:hypothetical protein
MFLKPGRIVVAEDNPTEIGLVNRGFRSGHGQARGFG